MTWPCVMFEQIGRRAYDDRSGSYAVYRGPDGNEYTYKTLPFGAMFYDDACVYGANCKRPDGRCLVVKVPTLNGAGDPHGLLWHIDHASSGDGAGWARRGTPPHVTATPSVDIQGAGGYHGFLTHGELTNDLNGRTYDGESS